MIKRISMFRDSTDTPTKSYEFYPGLNIVLADRAKESGDKGTRNGAGKSTLIEIIDFCLGAKPNKDTTLPVEDLPGWEFVLEIEIRGQMLAVRRSCDSPNRVFVKGELKDCPVSSSVPQDMATKEFEYNREQWMLLLGWALFGLAPFPPQETANYLPKYETLICHLIRMVFDNPLNAGISDYRTRAELAATYLLGLNYQFLVAARLLSKERRKIESRRSATVDQASEWVKDIKLLESKCKAIKSELERRKDALEQFSTAEEFTLINETLGELTNQALPTKVWVAPI